MNSGDSETLIKPVSPSALIINRAEVQKDVQVATAGPEGMFKSCRKKMDGAGTHGLPAAASVNPAFSFQEMKHLKKIVTVRF